MTGFDFAFYEYQAEDITDYMSEAKDLFSRSVYQNSAYTVTPILDPEVYEVFFTQQFLDLYRVALSTGCTTKMNVDELKLLYLFIRFQDNQLNGFEPIPVIVFQALDKWTYDEVRCIAHDDSGDCDNYTHNPVLCP